MPHQVERVLGRLLGMSSGKVAERMTGQIARAEMLLPKWEQGPVVVPLSVEALREAPIATLIGKILEQVGSARELLSSRESTASSIERLAREDPVWGLGLAWALDRAGAHDSAAWVHLFKGLDARAEQVARSVLDFVATAQEVPRPNETTPWLAAALRSGTALTGEWTDAEDRAVDRVLDAALRGNVVDVVGLAAETAALRCRTGRPTAPVLALLHRALWEGQGREWKKLGVELHRLSALDAEWVRTAVLPALGPGLLTGTAQRVAAEQILLPANQPPVLFRDIQVRAVSLLDWIPWTEESVDFLIGERTQRLTSLGEMVVDLLARAAAGWRTVPVADWLGRFLVAAPAVARSRWIRKVGSLYRDAGAAAGPFWDGWMRSVWEALLEGDPVEIGDQEGGALTSWASLPGTPAHEALELMLKGPSLSTASGYDLEPLTRRADEAPGTMLAVLTRVVQETADEPGIVLRVPDVLGAAEGAPLGARRAFLNALVETGRMSGSEALVALGYQPRP